MTRRDRIDVLIGFLMLLAGFAIGSGLFPGLAR